MVIVFTGVEEYLTQVHVGMPIKKEVLQIPIKGVLTFGQNRNTDCDASRTRYATKKVRE